jgi:hypothetical protein
MARFSDRMVPEVVQVFWAAIARGEFVTAAAAEAGTYREKGTRWLAAETGIRPRRGRDLKGRCLTFTEREATPPPQKHLRPHPRRDPRRRVLHQAPQPAPTAAARGSQSPSQNRDPQSAQNARDRRRRLHPSRSTRTGKIELVTTTRLSTTKSNYSGVRGFGRNRWPLRGSLADAPG